MEIVSEQVPHIFRNRFMRDGNSFMMTTNSGGATGGSSGSFTPHYVWGQYDDGQTDIVGDFTTSANASIGGDVTINSSLKVDGNASVGKMYVNSSLFVGGQEIALSKYVRNDVTTEQTIKGDLRLKGSGNYGNSLLFGDGLYCYIHEDTDDHLLIHAANGVKIDGSLSGTTLTAIWNAINDISTRIANSSSS